MTPRDPAPSLSQPPVGQHDIYKTGDTDAPDCVKDRNGEVVLALCRRCNKGEAELDDGLCTPAPHDDEGLPCPFCAGVAAYMTADEAGPEAYVVTCMGCHASGAVHYAIKESPREKAIAAWNRRAPAPEQAEGATLKFVERARLEAAFSCSGPNDHRAVLDEVAAELARLTCAAAASQKVAQDMTDKCAGLEREVETLRANRDAMAHGEKVALQLFAAEKAEVERLTRERDSYETRAVESQMLAYKWMEQHDKLMTAVRASPDFLAALLLNDPRPPSPKPADVPECIKRAEAAEAALARAQKVAFVRGAREGWMRCGVYHVSIDFEDQKQEAEVARRWPMPTESVSPSAGATGNEGERT